MVRGELKQVAPVGRDSVRGGVAVSEVGEEVAQVPGERVSGPPLPGHGRIHDWHPSRSPSCQITGKRSALAGWRPCECPNLSARVTWACVVPCRRLRVSGVSRSRLRYGRLRSVLVCATVGTPEWLMTRRWWSMVS